MNPQALDKTIESGHVTFFSRTKQRLWTQAKPQAMCAEYRQCAPICDNDTLLVLAGSPVGPTCHKGTSSCFGDAGHQWLFLYQLGQLLAGAKPPIRPALTRRNCTPAVLSVLRKKVGEGVETALAATVNDRVELTNKKRLI